MNNEIFTTYVLLFFAHIGIMILAYIQVYAIAVTFTYIEQIEFVFPIRRIPRDGTNGIKPQ